MTPAASLVAADAAIVVVDGVAGVEVQTEKVWAFAEEFKLPRAVVVNKLDRDRADFRARARQRPGKLRTHRGPDPPARSAPNASSRASST